VPLTFHYIIPFATNFFGSYADVLARYAERLAALQQQTKSDTSPAKAAAGAGGGGTSRKNSIENTSSSPSSSSSSSSSPSSSSPAPPEPPSSSSTEPSVGAVLKAEARLGTLALIEGEYDDACKWLDQACARMRWSPYSPLIAAGLGGGGVSGAGGAGQIGAKRGAGGPLTVEDQLSSEDFEEIDMTMLLRRSGQAHLKRFDEDGLHYHLVSYAPERIAGRMTSGSCNARERGETVSQA